MLFPSQSAARLRTAAQAAGTPHGRLDSALAWPLADPDHPGARYTLLAVCPNSEAVTRTALLAAQEACTPLLYAATLNQIDRGEGYTG